MPEPEEERTRLEALAQLPSIGTRPSGALRAVASPVGRESPGYIVSLKMVGAVPRELWVDGKRIPLPSCKSTIPELSGEPVAAATGGSSTTLLFYVPRASTAVSTGDAAAGVDRLDADHAPPGDAVFDAVVAQFGRCLLSEVERAQQQAGGVFVEYVALALIAYVVRTYGGTKVEPRPARGGLAPWQERRTKQILGENLDGKVTLACLARECGLSVSHFARAFKQTTGHPPHRWLLARRVEEAKELLLSSALPLAEVAIACGFADQSHFTRVFSQLAGAGPGAWRRARTANPIASDPSCAAHGMHPERD